MFQFADKRRTAAMHDQDYTDDHLRMTAGRGWRPEPPAHPFARNFRRQRSPARDSGPGFARRAPAAGRRSGHGFARAQDPQGPSGGGGGRPAGRPAGQDLCDRFRALLCPLSGPGRRPPWSSASSSEISGRATTSMHASRRPFIWMTRRAACRMAGASSPAWSVLAAGLWRLASSVVGRRSPISRCRPRQC